MDFIFSELADFFSNFKLHHSDCPICTLDFKKGDTAIQVLNADTWSWAHIECATKTGGKING